MSWNNSSFNNNYRQLTENDKKLYQTQRYLNTFYPYLPVRPDATVQNTKQSPKLALPQKPAPPDYNMQKVQNYGRPQGSLQPAIAYRPSVPMMPKADVLYPAKQPAIEEVLQKNKHEYEKTINRMINQSPNENSDIKVSDDQLSYFKYETIRNHAGSSQSSYTRESSESYRSTTFAGVARSAVGVAPGTERRGAIPTNSVYPSERDSVSQQAHPIYIYLGYIYDDDAKRQNDSKIAGYTSKARKDQDVTSCGYNMQPQPAFPYAVCSPPMTWQQSTYEPVTPDHKSDNTVRPYAQQPAVASDPVVTIKVCYTPYLHEYKHDKVPTESKKYKSRVFTKKRPGSVYAYTSAYNKYWNGADYQNDAQQHDVPAKKSYRPKDDIKPFNIAERTEALAYRQEVIYNAPSTATYKFTNYPAPVYSTAPYSQPTPEPVEYYHQYAAIPRQLSYPDVIAAVDCFQLPPQSENGNDTVFGCPVSMMSESQKYQLIYQIDMWKQQLCLQQEQYQQQADFSEQQARLAVLYNDDNMAKQHLQVVLVMQRYQIDIQGRLDQLDLMTSKLYKKELNYLKRQCGMIK